MDLMKNYLDAKQAIYDHVGFKPDIINGWEFLIEEEALEECKKRNKGKKKTSSRK